MTTCKNVATTITVKFSSNIGIPIFLQMTKTSVHFGNTTPVHSAHKMETAATVIEIQVSDGNDKQFCGSSNMLSGS